MHICILTEKLFFIYLPMTKKIFYEKKKTQNKRKCLQYVLSKLKNCEVKTEVTSFRRSRLMALHCSILFPYTIHTHIRYGVVFIYFMLLVSHIILMAKDLCQQYIFLKYTVERVNVRGKEWESGLIRKFLDDDHMNSGTYIL